MNKWKYWITVAGWKLNVWLHSSRLSRLPLVRSIWLTGKQVMAGWLTSGRGVPVVLDGWPSYIHPYSIAYGIKNYEPYTSELLQNALPLFSTSAPIMATSRCLQLAALDRKVEFTLLSQFPRISGF